MSFKLNIPKHKLSYYVVRFMPYFSICFLAICICLNTHADEIELDDGRVFEGIILSQNSDQVVFEAYISGIPAKLTFRMRQVVRLEKKEFKKPEKKKVVTPPDKDKDDKTQQPDDKVELLKDITYYLVIPIHGTFGITILPEYVEKSLEYAKKHQIKHIVFDIDSGGGYLDAGLKIAEVMQKYDREFTYHAYIRKAISASIWVVFNCDHIYMTKGATLGGAVVFHTNTSTGSAEVDAKQNSIFASQLATRAEEKGHNGNVVRAMIMPSVTLYSKKLADDKYEIVTSGNGLPVIDNDKSILTLTDTEAASHNVVKKVELISDIGRLIQIKNWLYGSDTPYVYASINIMKKILSENNALYYSLTKRSKYEIYPKISPEIPEYSDVIINKRLMSSATIIKYDKSKKPIVLDTSLEVTQYINKLRLFLIEVEFTYYDELWYVPRYESIDYGDGRVSHFKVRGKKDRRFGLNLLGLNPKDIQLIDRLCDRINHASISKQLRADYRFPYMQNKAIPVQRIFKDIPKSVFNKADKNIIIGNPKASAMINEKMLSKPYIYKVPSNKKPKIVNADNYVVLIYPEDQIIRAFGGRHKLQILAVYSGSEKEKINSGVMPKSIIGNAINVRLTNFRETSTTQLMLYCGN